MRFLVNLRALQKAHAANQAIKASVSFINEEKTKLVVDGQVFSVRDLRMITSSLVDQLEGLLDELTFGHFPSAASVEHLWKETLLRESFSSRKAGFSPIQPLDPRILLNALMSMKPQISNIFYLN